MDAAMLPAPLQKSRLVMEQNERWLPGLGWSGEYLFYTDGPEWNCSNELKADTKHLHGQPGVPLGEQVPPRGWVWTLESTWTIQNDTTTDSDGWGYAFNVGDPMPWSKQCRANHFFRRRLWYRQVVYDPVAYLSGEATEVESSVFRPRQLGSEPIRRTYEVFENERWVMLAGWSTSHLFPTDPDRYTDTLKGAPKLKEPPLSPHWRWITDWRVEVTEHTDSQGWEYSFNFALSSWTNKAGSKSFVRRRKWLRGLQYSPPVDQIDLSAALNNGDNNNNSNNSNNSNSVSISNNTVTAARESNFQLLTGPLLQELVSEEQSLPSNEDERLKVVADLNGVAAALASETFQLETTGRAAVQFLDMANKQRLNAHAIPIMNPRMELFRAWLMAPQKRDALPGLPGSVDNAAILERARLLDERVSGWLEAREHLAAAEQQLRPGLLKTDTQVVDEGDAEL